jgi:hypothetical protein
MVASLQQSREDSMPFDFSKDAGGDAILLGVMNEMIVRLEGVIRADDPSATEANVQLRLDLAANGMRSGLQSLRNVGARGVKDFGPPTMWQSALINAGISPATVADPYSPGN